MREAQARERLRRLLQAQPLGVLATSGTGGPHATLVAFASTDDLRHVVFATSRQTRKYESLRQDPKAALLVDDRSNDVRDFRDASAATVHGTAAEVQPEQLGEVRALYLGKHPYLEEFVRAPSCALISIAAESYDLVGHFQEVYVLRVADGMDSTG